MQRTVNKCAKFELNSLRNWPPVKAIVTEVNNIGARLAITLAAT